MNKYLHTVASVGSLFTLNYDARNHELKKIVFRGVIRIKLNSNLVILFFVVIFK